MHAAMFHFNYGLMRRGVRIMAIFMTTTAALQAGWCVRWCATAFDNLLSWTSHRQTVVAQSQQQQQQRQQQQEQQEPQQQQRQQQGQQQVQQRQQQQAQARKQNAADQRKRTGGAPPGGVGS